MAQLHFIELGDPSNDTVVFLHGVGVASRYWTPQFDNFSKRFHILAPDLPGFAKSAPSENAFLEDAARAVHQLILTKTLRSVHLCGLSLGAMVALQLASEQPAYLKSLVLSAPQIKPPAFLMAFQNFIMRMATEQGLISQLEQLIPADDETMRGYIREDLQQTGKRGLLEVIRAVGSADLRNAVRQIDVPTYIINGAKDWSNRGAAKKLARIIPNTKLDFIEGARHLVSYEKAEVFNQKVLAFLESQPLTLHNV